MTLSKSRHPHTLATLFLPGLIATALAGTAAAQSTVALETRQDRLQALSTALLQRDSEDRRQARAFATSAGLPLRRILADERVLELQRIAPGIGPVFYITNNIVAADTTSTDEVWPGGSAGLNLDGAGMTMAEWDGGAVFPDHPDFTGRLTQIDTPAEVSGHSTHVAGTLIGAGNAFIDSRGMAHAAHLNAYDWNSDTAEMAAAAAGGQLVSNHSYGVAAGWLHIGDLPPDNWWWIGGAADTDLEDPNFGYYDSESQLWDQIAFDAPYYLIVKAAGNDRSDYGPPDGEEYTIIDQDGNFVATSTLPRPADCAPAGYDCLPTHSVAKNILTVGAVDDLPGGYSEIGGPSQVVMSEFSSWGPTDDGRIKPDLVGNGVFLFSAWPDDPYYALAAGTSMSTPNVSGSLLLLQQHYENLNGPGQYLRAATLKALAIHTADESGPAPGPDYAFGWGLLNTLAAADVISGAGADHQIIEAALLNGAQDSYPVTVSQAGAVLTATLVWPDPPGTPAAPALDPTDLMLVNDLDLRIIRGGSTWLPWVLDPANPAAAATTGDNIRDNVEQVRIVDAGIGSYTVEVGHKSTLLDSLPQDYALIISVDPPPPVSSGFIIDEDFSGGLPPGWSVETVSGVSWTIRTPVNGDPRYDNLTGGTGQFAMVDNNFSHRTVTSLRTSVLDLSAAEEAVLRFSSRFSMDTFESINVDASTDSGGNWLNVWTWQGFNPFPTRYVQDLSNTIAGETGVILRFRFDSLGETQGDYWQVDDIELEIFGGDPPAGDPPGPPSGPSPTDGAVDQSTDTDLAWSPGTLADSHDVYFGTVNPPGGSEFRGNHPGTSYDPGPLQMGTTYFWRIDEVNADGNTPGPVWSFTTAAPSSEMIYIDGFETAAEPPAKGRWTATVGVAIADQDDQPEESVTVEGNWSDGANGSDSCTTGGDGRCSVSKRNLKQNTPSVRFTVTELVKPGATYDSGSNTAGDSVVVSQNDIDQVPAAVDDAYATDADSAVSGNVLDNDDPGNGPSSIDSHTLPADGSLSLADNGTFTYTPDAGFTGEDAFTYRIIDQDGDLSNTATVTLSVGGSPPPPPPGDLQLDARPYKVKGVQHVELTWQNFSGPDVDIRRDGGAPTTTANDGSHIDNIGVKGGGQSYVYEVCESETSNCALAVATF
ncbi:S8 family serine peptidase [Elongatibacter sediminis]|uniref:S8 family serine peptidase n=1 Tax=Elongatibacter sediminis TaxID=3119006 RepID=A0AAW9REA6_9GAMM